MDNARGLYATETIYYDSDVQQIESLPDTQLHRDVDLEIVGADKEGAPTDSYSTPVRA